MCHGDIKDILSGCPIIKFDAWVDLKINHENGTNGHPAKHLSGAIENTVSEELIREVVKNAKHTCSTESPKEYEPPTKEEVPV